MIKSTKSMEKAIKGTNQYYKSVFTEEQRERVCYGQQWEDLRVKLGWRDEHSRGVLELKDVRHLSAHPDADADELKKP